MGNKRCLPVYLTARQAGHGRKVVRMIGTAPSYREALDLARQLQDQQEAPIKIRECPTTVWAEDAVVLQGPCC